jgi:UDP-N-acetyl-2-amino-2-deoxyglucuronate dehydrogenase
MGKHRLAVIGAGMAAAPHALSLQELAARAEVAGVHARNATRLNAFCAKFGFPAATDLDALLADRSINAALVLTPPNTHLDLVDRLSAAGKHILLEKPLEIDLARARKLVELCEARGVTLGVVLQSRFSPAAAKVQELLASGALGEIANASVSARWWRPQSYYDEPGRGTYARDGGGVMMTQAIHVLDVFLSFTGEPVEVLARCATSKLHRMEAEDVAIGILRFANGALASIDVSTASYPGFPERIELVGTRATATYQGGALDVHFHDGTKQNFGEVRGTGSGKDPMAFSHLGHKAVIADFLEAIDAKRAPRANGRSVLAVHRLIDALTESVRSGRAVQMAAA